MNAKTEITVVYKTSKKIKFLIALLTIAFLGSILWIRLSTPINMVFMSNYGFSEVDGLVTAHGSWVSPTSDLANPLQTVEIECFRQLGHCFSYTAELSEGNYLSVSSELYEIETWGDDAVITKPNEFKCVEYQLTLNRRSKTVTNIRHTIDNKSEFCVGTQDEPITLTLGDGDQRVQKYKTKN